MAKVKLPYLQVHLYGWRQLVLIGPRVWRWGWSINVTVLSGSSLFLGLSAGKDEDGEFEMGLGLGVAKVWLRTYRMFTRREQRRRHEEVGELLADEAESYLGMQS